MDAGLKERTSTEAVGVFKTAVSLETAIKDLLSDGFDHADLSLLADEKTVEAKLGHAYRSVRELEDNPAAPRRAFISGSSLGNVEGGLVGVPMYIGAIAAAGGAAALGGPLIAVFAAAAVAGAAGGLIGSGLARLVDQNRADYYAEQIGHGGLLLWVRTRDAAHERRAVAILQKHAGQDVHMRDLAGG